MLKLFLLKQSPFLKEFAENLVKLSCHSGVGKCHQEGTPLVL